LVDGSLESPYDFLFIIIELFSLTLTVEARQNVSRLAAIRRG